MRARDGIISESGVRTGCRVIMGVVTLKIDRFLWTFVEYFLVVQH